MRLKLGRPDLRRYDDLFAVPRAEGELSVTFFGVASLLLTDGATTLMTDGFFSRPPLLRCLTRRLAPDAVAIEDGLRRLGLGQVDVIVPVHTHFDHALDSAAVAARTGATLAGGESAANIARGHGLSADRTRVLRPGTPVPFGAFTLTLVESAHCPPDRYPGAITAPLVPPARASAYRCGESWSVLVEHATGRSALIQGSAGSVPGALRGRHAEVAYLGVGQLGLAPSGSARPEDRRRTESYIREYWAETVEAVGARRVVLIHWDDFFRPLDAKHLRALPYAGDDLDVTLRVLGQLSHEQRVPVLLPTPWAREDPWAGLSQ